LGIDNADVVVFKSSVISDEVGEVFSLFFPSEC